MQPAHAAAEASPFHLPQFVLTLLPPIDLPHSQQQQQQHAIPQPSFNMPPWYGVPLPGPVSHQQTSGDPFAVQPPPSHFHFPAQFSRFQLPVAQHQATPFVSVQQPETIALAVPVLLEDQLNPLQDNQLPVLEDNGASSRASSTSHSAVSPFRCLSENLSKKSTAHKGSSAEQQQHKKLLADSLCVDMLAYFDAIIWLALWNNKMGEGEQAKKCSHHIDWLKDEHSMLSAAASMEEALREAMKNYCK
eukprot:2823562-Rhodomonas_salina.1